MEQLAFLHCWLTGPISREHPETEDFEIRRRAKATATPEDPNSKSFAVTQKACLLFKPYKPSNENEVEKSLRSMHFIIIAFPYKSSLVQETFKIATGSKSRACHCETRRHASLNRGISCRFEPNGKPQYPDSTATVAPLNTWVMWPVIPAEEHSMSHEKKLRLTCSKLVAFTSAPRWINLTVFMIH